MSEYLVCLIVSPFIVGYMVRPKLLCPALTFANVLLAAGTLIKLSSLNKLVTRPEKSLHLLVDNPDTSLHI